MNSLLMTSCVVATCLHVSNKCLKEYIQSQMNQIRSIHKLIMLVHDSVIAFKDPDREYKLRNIHHR